ncbi:gustatory receptor for sugar taste 64e-like [Plodia interpunctella]|uniref:gustatory receptor for sugar taste 64e-like n=1 Tax=Plodia interpunctella TaxID=58824 RepID=UPI0023681898|nr:gustatory receptor for sugar taste 64e-like [Plodia interpunctella]
MATHCTPQNGAPVLKIYFDLIFVSIFRYIDFSYVAAGIFQIVKIQFSMLATLNNVLIIACSAYLENRFNHLNTIIAKDQEDNTTTSMDWHKIRDHYGQLTKLVKIIDKRINPIVFLSFFSDLYNLCLQCYYVVSRRNYYYLVNYSDCIQEQSGLLQTRFYKPFAAVFTFIKMISVSILCARLYTSSRRPLSCLHTVPKAAYNNDAHRFMEQVYHSKIALSGFEFFYITKEMMITVLGILVTYELVLIQLKS